MPRGPSVLTLYSAADLLTGPGCPACRYAAEASDRYLRWFALEGHSQPITITRLCASLGMCAAHTRRLMNQPGAAFRLTAVYRYVISAARDRLAGRARPPAACPGCEHDDAASRRALDTLLDELADTAVLDRCRELGGLCLSHLAAAAAYARPRLIAPLAEVLRHTMASSDPVEWLTGVDDDAEDRVVLRRAISSAGAQHHAACWPCLAGAQAEREALLRLPGLAGQGPDPALALCAGHLADAAAAPDASGVRQLLAWQVRCLTSRLSAGRSRWPRTALRQHKLPGVCPVCRARDVGARRALTGVRSRPHDRAAGTALCVRHHLDLRACDARRAGELAEDAIGRAGQLAAELTDAFDRAARAHGEGVPRPGSAAWRQAAAFLDGSVFGGLCWPLPASSPRA